jgi:hypothetical protein
LAFGIGMGVRRPQDLVDETLERLALVVVAEDGLQPVQVAAGAAEGVAEPRAVGGRPVGQADRVRQRTKGAQAGSVEIHRATGPSCDRSLRDMA